MVVALINTRKNYFHLVTIYGIVAGVTFAIVVAALIFMALRYRGGSKKSVSRRSENNVLELGYVVVLVLVAVFLLTVTYRTENSTDRVFALPVQQKLPTQVRIIAAKWHWSFYYPGHNIGIVGTDTHNPTLVVPTNTEVAFQMTSIDVIHAFWVIQDYFKRNAYPQRTARFALIFTKPGFFRGGGDCAEFCGFLHANMRFNIRALPMAQFRAWERRREGQGASTA